MGPNISTNDYFCQPDIFTFSNWAQIYYCKEHIYKLNTNLSILSSCFVTTPIINLFSQFF
jgi:hypothetical protein